MYAPNPSYLCEPNALACPRTRQGTPPSSLPAFDLAKRTIEFVENAESFLNRSTSGDCPEPRLRVVLGNRDGREFFHQLVHAHTAMSSQLLQSFVRVVW